MITLFVGQRGVGKSSLLKRMEHYGRRLQLSPRLVDLDQEIARGENLSISDIFQQRGEAPFRDLEKKYFSDILSGHQDETQEVFIFVGGGFNLLWIPRSVRVVWLRRASDTMGRIFLDRPPLEKDMGPLEEYFFRAGKRQEVFQRLAWEEYFVPEGLVNSDSVEEQILFGRPEKVGGCLTLLPQNFRSEEVWQSFIGRRKLWGVSFFEIRDDLLTEQQIQWALRDLPKTSLLWSRRSKELNFKLDPSWVSCVDFDLSLWESEGVSIMKERDPGEVVVSLHERNPNETLERLLARLDRLQGDGVSQNYSKSLGLHIKLAVEVEDFRELQLCHDWAQKNPHHRSFLPRSLEGRWQWYRLWMGDQQKINFWREGDGSGADQPTLFQWIKRHLIRRNRVQKLGPETFAALLGDPVFHSFTPIEQGPFFEQLGCPVLAISLQRPEFARAMDFLNKIGLRAAAVTAPLKVSAFEWTGLTLSKEAHNLGAVNTLARRSEGPWHGHNTDMEGLEALWRTTVEAQGSVNSVDIAVWGGGGTLPLFKELLPQAHYFSIQTGQRRGKTPAAEETPASTGPEELPSATTPRWGPHWVVWAASTFHPPGTMTIPSHWRPRLVMDLNYRSDSGGRELALRTGAAYISGLSMFLAQAKGQREYWKTILETSSEGES